MRSYYFIGERHGLGTHTFQKRRAMGNQSFSSPQAVGKNFHAGSAMYVYDIQFNRAVPM